VAATLEVESGSNDPFAVFLTIVLVQFILIGEQTWQQVVLELARETIIGALLGWLGGRAIVFVLNHLGLPQGLHAPFVTTGALVVFAFTSTLHGSGFLAVYLAGLIVGNRATRAHNTVIVFLDAVTWLAQIAMFVLLGLLVTPEHLIDTLLAALAVAVTLMIFARPVAVFLCLKPFPFPWREKAFISWVGLRGAGNLPASILARASEGRNLFNIVCGGARPALIQGWLSAGGAALLCRAPAPRSMLGASTDPGASPNGDRGCPETQLSPAAAAPCGRSRRCGAGLKSLCLRPIRRQLLIYLWRCLRRKCSTVFSSMPLPAVDPFLLVFPASIRS
jgi:hypothetical protein